MNLPNHNVANRTGENRGQEYALQQLIVSTQVWATHFIAFPSTISKLSRFKHLQLISHPSKSTWRLWTVFTSWSRTSLYHLFALDHLWQIWACSVNRQDSTMIRIVMNEEFGFHVMIFFKGFYCKQVYLWTSLNSFVASHVTEKTSAYRILVSFQSCAPESVYMHQWALCVGSWNIQSTISIIYHPHLWTYAAYEYLRLLSVPISSNRWILGSPTPASLPFGNSLRTNWVFPKIMVPPKSSILIGFSIINHPFWGYHYFWKHPIQLFVKLPNMSCLLPISISGVSSMFPETHREPNMGNSKMPLISNLTWGTWAPYLNDEFSAQIRSAMSMGISSIWVW